MPEQQIFGCEGWVSPFVIPVILRVRKMRKMGSKLRGQVNGFSDQFGEGSGTLPQYVGLKGEGKLAQATHPT